jgi:lysophospholipid acyltransferase (LPLAT)-like uncharacterized protein
MEASKFWSLASWDRTQIPRPFSTVALAVGLPIEVAADADEQQIEAKRTEVEMALLNLEQQAAQLLSRTAKPYAKSR